MEKSKSRATVQRSVADSEVTYPLWPPVIDGCVITSNEEMQYPVEVDYDYSDIDRALFDQPVTSGLDQWAPLLPPLLPDNGLGEGGTPLHSIARLADWSGINGELFIKDETQNPTWSHKDRLNRCAISAAQQACAPGVVVASSGNHGASAAAYSARTGIPCIVLVSAEAPKAILSFVRGYGAAAIALPSTARWGVLRLIREQFGYHPVSNQTTIHTGHPFGSEGYKTIAYELYRQLGGVAPGTVFVPTGYGEMLFGVWKGFDELQRLGVIDTVPQIISCEPEVRAPLARSFVSGRPAMIVEGESSDAYAIGSSVSGYRGIVALTKSNGFAVTVTDDDMYAAQREMGKNGLWHELSSVISLAALRKTIAQRGPVNGPVVCITTSSGFKDLRTGQHEVPASDGDWDEVQNILKQSYGITA